MNSTNLQISQSPNLQINPSTALRNKISKSLNIQLNNSTNKKWLKEMGFPDFLAGLFAKVVPKLERWRDKPQ
jgi:hypothetical protein